ncbi:hypothetical protein CHLRE_02g086100v5 [Chlamydomonas reinhardtii]|uniref:Uncharacterized protein n=1 Tax=Chlamydomonas reinhardtii TaxID=3055 RepID=A0A2K3E0Y4_CHLRE|nr:uncharacterized protein CHLRE_02g086100v5 [Chlamydomonas reinhardtii]PNW86429.1 hypothetical protein CHLRE_02g086100v5 [Chlamydomonas reinhardtii]
MLHHRQASTSVVQRGQSRRAAVAPMCTLRVNEPVPVQQRLLSAGIAAATSLVLLASFPLASSAARLELPNKEVDDATSPFVQELLKRSNENRERYQKERLQDYYRRNFKEYFEFEGSTAKVGKARGLSPETQQAIAKWLEENK